MNPARLALCILLAVPSLPAQSGATAPLDGLSILQKMGQQYAAAQSWYFVATEEQTMTNDYSRTWKKTVMISAATGNKYHYEGHSETGSAFHISDGRTAWDIHPEEHAYTREPAPDNGYEPPRTTPFNESAALHAFGLRTEFATFSAHYSAATRLPDETIFQNGIAVPCYVVQVNTTPRRGPVMAGASRNETLWIDKSSWAVLRTVSHEKSFMLAGSAQIPLAIDAVTTWTTAELNTALPEALFHFDPLPDLKLVAKFSDRILGVDLTGQTAPEVHLVGADGKTAPLSSWRGKPVLLDFWATWCAPCVEALPWLAQLEQEAAPKGLVLLSIDEDEDAKAAGAFLAQHHYTWPNTHDTGSIGQAFGELGLPLLVLIDAHGKIVFDQFSEDGLRKALAGLGPQFASLDRADNPHPAPPPSH